MDASGETSAPVFHRHIERKVVRPPPKDTAQGRLQIKTLAQEFLQAWMSHNESLSNAENKEE